MTTRRARGGVGLVVAGALVLVSCVAEDGGASSGGGDGVPAGASQEEYREAFADVEPITLQAQTPNAPDSSNSVHIQKFAAALDEWSDGTIELDIAYGNAIAEPEDAPDALADGRMDFDYVYPLYDPSRYPANSALADVSFLGEHTPVAGSLQAMGGFLEAGFDTPEIGEEMADEGVKLLVPYGPVSSPGLLCTEQRNGAEDVRGMQVRVGSSAHVEQAEALDMSPISLQYSETYEALQRGTADCGIGTSWSYDMMGVLPLAPHYAIDPQVGFSRLPFGLGFGMDEWESLPLVAQQLIYDRLDVYIESMFEDYIWPSIQDAAETMQEEGGSVTRFDSGMQDRLDEVNEELLDEVRSSDALDGETFLADLTESLDRWQGIVDELGYPDVDDEELLDRDIEEDIDIGPFLERLTSEVLTEHRPE